MLLVVGAISGCIKGGINYARTSPLIRSVSADELNSIKSTGQFSSSGYSESKWFATNSTDASKWANWFGQSDYVGIRVPKSTFKNFYFDPLLDNIAPVYNIEISYLNSILKVFGIFRRNKMNKKVFDVIIEWFSKDEGGRVDVIPFKKMRYAPHIGINGERIINGSAWSVLCYVYEHLEPLKTKAYIRFLNTDDAPDILNIGMEFELFEGSKKVATGTIVANSNFKFIL